MNKNKLIEIKTKVKHYTPEICAGIGLIAGISAFVIAVNIPNVKLPLNYGLDLPKSVIKRMIETGEDLSFDTPQLKLLVKLTDN